MINMKILKTFSVFLAFVSFFVILTVYSGILYFAVQWVGTVNNGSFSEFIKTQLNI